MAQKHVGGLVEVLRLNDDRMMLINEEGKLKGLTLNGRASDLAWFYHAMRPDDHIVGNALVCDTKMFL